MHAVVETGGKQYRVASGDVIKVERVEGEAGSSITLDKVLYASDGKTIKIGKPLVEKATISAEILEQRRADKIIIFKKTRRQTYRRKNGHRQYQTVLRIGDITLDGKKATAPKKAAKADKPVEEKKATTKKPAAKKTAAKKD